MKPKRRTIVALCAAAILLLVWCVLQFARVRMIHALPDMLGAERFSPAGSYAQISCYFAENVMVQPERFREFHYRMETALTQKAIGQDAEQKDARLFLDCFSMEGSVSLSRGKKKVEASAIGTGGDFFYLHPVELISGMYYNADALMSDQILIDESIAWQLFGGNDVAGQTVDIGGVPHLISGVVKSGQGRMREAAGMGGALVYLSYRSLSNYGNPRGGEARMESYELILPDPVRGFAKDLVRETLGYSEEETEIVDDSRRFDNIALWRILQHFGLRSMTGNAMHYPWWENMARGTEDVLVLILIGQALCLAVPLLIVTVLVVQSYRHKQWTAGSVLRGISDRIYQQRSRAARKKKQQGRTV